MAADGGSSRSRCRRCPRSGRGTTWAARSWPPGALCGAQEPELAPRPGDVLVVTQKVVSKAEGRIVDLRTVEPRPEAVAFGERWDRDPRQVEVVLRESAADPAHGARCHHLAHPARLRLRQRRRGRLERGRAATR